MTGRERIHAALKGEPVDRVPFALNIWQWFYAQLYRGTLPDEYVDCKTPIAFLKKYGADIITRWDGQIKGRAGLGQFVRFPNCRYRQVETGQRIKMPITTAFNHYQRLNRIHSTIETAHGTLSQTWRLSEEICADFEEQYWVRDWQRDFRSLQAVVRDRTYDIEMDQYVRDLAEVGSYGIIMVEIPENPIKMLHWLMGPENATLAVLDHQDQCRKLFDIHTEMTLQFIDGVCEKTTYDDTPLLMSNDNLDAALMPPSFFDTYLYDHYRKVSERIHDHGRLFAVHSCGNNWDLRHCIRNSGIDMMEGLTPPPLGNFPLHEARKEIGDHFVVEGGNNYIHQEMTGGAEEAIDAHTKQLLIEMRDTPRFIYSSSCQTSPNTPIDNLHYFRDAVWKYGTCD